MKIEIVNFNHSSVVPILHKGFNDEKMQDVQQGDREEPNIQQISI